MASLFVFILIMMFFVIFVFLSGRKDKELPKMTREQAAQAVRLLKDNGYKRKEIEKLRSRFTGLKELIDLLKDDHFGLKCIEDIIDCSTINIPQGLYFKEDNYSGSLWYNGPLWFHFSADEIDLYPSKSERENRHIKIRDLICMTGCERLIHPNVIDFLYNHPEKIPKKWQGINLFSIAITFQVKMVVTLTGSGYVSAPPSRQYQAVYRFLEQYSEDISVDHQSDWCALGHNEAVLIRKSHSQ